MTVVFTHLLALWLVGVPVPQKPAATRVIASSSDWKITAKQFDDIVASLPPEGRQRFATAANRRGLLNELVRIWVLTTEARKKGINVGTDYTAQRDFYVEYGRQIGSRIGEETIQDFYKTHVADYERVRLSQILIFNGSSPIVPNEGITGRLPYEEALKRAQEVKMKLQDGAKFEDLVKEYSQDVRSAPRGGDIGYISRGQIPKEMEDVAFALKVGQFSDIVGSVYGFHLLKAMDNKVIPLEQVQDRIRQKLRSDAVNDDIEPKVKAARVTIDESYFK